MEFDITTADIEGLLDDLAASHEDAMACSIAIGQGGLSPDKNREYANREIVNRQIIMTIRCELRRRFAAK